MNLLEKRGQHLFLGDKRVSFIYYRSLYNQDDYNETNILRRAYIESANVVAIPSIEIQLVGLKKYQSLICKADAQKKIIPITAEILQKINNRNIDLSGYVLKG